MRISDWSSDVCSSDLRGLPSPLRLGPAARTQVSRLSPEGERAEKSVRALRRLHNLGQHPAHVARMDEEARRPMRPDPRLAQHVLAQLFERGLGGLDVGDFVAHMMLPARRVLFEEARDRGDRKSKRLNSSHYCAPR